MRQPEKRGALVMFFHRHTRNRPPNSAQYMVGTWEHITKKPYETPIVHAQMLTSRHVLPLQTNAPVHWEVRQPVPARPRRPWFWNHGMSHLRHPRWPRLKPQRMTRMNPNLVEQARHVPHPIVVLAFLTLISPLDRMCPVLNLRANTNEKKPLEDDVRAYNMPTSPLAQVPQALGPTLTSEPPYVHSEPRTRLRYVPFYENSTFDGGVRQH